MTLAIACSGGGNWCIAQLGFIHALHERGYRTQAASGVSFGSWSAYSAVTGDTLGVMKRVRHFREHLDMNLFKPWRHGAGLNVREMVQRMEAALRAALPTRAETGGDYFVMAVKVPVMKSIAFDKQHTLPEMLRAAMAMPPLPAARYAGHVLRDAGLRIKYGIRPLVEAGYKKVLCLGTFGDQFDVRWKGLRRVIPAYRDVETHEVVMNMVRKIGAVDFTRAGLPVMEAVFEEGYRVGRRFSSHILDDLINPVPDQEMRECRVMASA